MAPNNPQAEIHPGGIAYLPYTITDLDDVKTLVRTEVLGWAAGFAREIRLEVDYVVPK